MPTDFADPGSTKKFLLKAVATPTFILNLLKKKTDMNQKNLGNIGNAKFCQLDFVSTGRAGQSASKTLKKEAAKLFTQKEVNYADIIS